MIQQTVRILRRELPDNQRILMISDIHGHADGLREVLRKADFSTEDVLVIVGDLCEKGPQTLKTIRDVMALCRKYTVYPLMGNVDLARLEMLMSDDPAVQKKLVKYSLSVLKWWPATFLGEMCKEAGFVLDENMDTQTVFPLLRKQFSQEIAFLSSLPTILETQRIIFVHGGIPHERLDELEGESCYPVLKRDAFLDEGLSFQKYVAVGHWPAALYGDQYPCHNPVIDRKRHILCLDGGCGVKSDGQLNLLAMPHWQSDDFTLYTWDGLPQIIALEDQQASEKSCYIRWTRELPPVTVLEKKGDMCHIRYKNHELDVPSSLLWTENGVTYCDDTTDYRLPVCKGDRLALISKGPMGCYVKKNGIAGWYQGAYQKEK